MKAAQGSIRHVSDTARWVAVYRARETERPDALFRDPFARRLAGERGEEIARSLPIHNRNSWSWTARTFLVDRLILEQVHQGADLVINLAAGLDARPYRMELPAALRWVELDLPDILDYKEEILAREKPACALERIRIDLADAAARSSLLNSMIEKSQKALIVSEGLLIYLSPDQVGALASDLAGIPTCRNWVTDIQSPGLLRMIQKTMAPQISEGAAKFQFAPENGPDFFKSCGWAPVEVHSMLKTAARLRRLPFLFRFFALLPERPERMGSRPWSAVCLLANGRS